MGIYISADGPCSGCIHMDLELGSLDYVSGKREYFLDCKHKGACKMWQDKIMKAKVVVDAEEVK